MKKRFAQFMLMLMVAIVPYTASPFIAPASAESCASNGAIVEYCAQAVVGLITPIVTTVEDCVGNGSGQCCQHANPNGNGCSPPPPPCPYSPCPTNVSSP